jgi:thiamine pyrophosphokinase
MAFNFFRWAMSQEIVIMSGGCLGDTTFFQKKIAAMKQPFIICCDGGARHLAAAGIKPDVLLGDMDSIDQQQMTRYAASGVKVIKYPANKDFTDTALALDYAMNLHPEGIYIWGALGGRIDHALANLFLLIRAKEAGIKTCLVDEYCEAFVPEGEVIFENAQGCPVSLLALSPRVEGITFRGFLYPLSEETLLMVESRGISNVIDNTSAVIRIRSGNLLVIRFWQKDIYPEVA